MDAILRKYRGYLVLTLVYAIALGAVLILRQPRIVPIRIVDPAPRPTATPVLIVVHVTGAVLRPDVYALVENSRLKDALSAAGGAIAEADVAGLNLAQPLRDGQQVRIPAKGEVLPTAVPAAATANNPAQPGAPVNINTATAAELDVLPGIGPTLAQRIVDDRTANGPFGSIEDLTRVKGIGPSVVEKIRGLVVVR